MRAIARTSRTAQTSRTLQRLCLRAEQPYSLVDRSLTSTSSFNLRWAWSHALILCPHHPLTPATRTSSPIPLPRRSYASRSTARPPLSRLRNFGVIAHIDAGKTTTTERLLYYSNHTHTLGNIDTANTHTDFLPEERRRGITIKAAAVSIEWREHSLSLIDTPGHVDFTQEVESTLRVMDSAVLLTDAVKGVQAQTVTVYAQAQRYGLPTIGYVNKMDREGADMVKVRRLLEERTGKPVLPVQLPVYEREREADSFIGVIDLIELQELRWDMDEDGRQYTTHPVTAEHPQFAATQAARESLCEAIAEHDDTFTSLFLSADGGTIGCSEVRAALRRLVVSNSVIPLLCGSSLRNKGVQPLMDAIVHYAPSPADVTNVRVKVQSHKQQAASKRRAARSGGRGQRDAGRQEEVRVEEERVVQVREDGPLLALAFKVTHDLTRTPLPLVLVRVYSGTLTQNSALVNTTAHNRNIDSHASSSNSALEPVKERPLRLLSVDGENTEEVSSIPAGCVGALVGLKYTVAGDTLIRAGDEPVTLPAIASPPPVFFASISPASSADEERLNQALACMLREDPSLSLSHSAETGQTLLQGQGALHLQIAYNALQEQWRVRAELGRVRVAYREGVLGESEEVMYVWESGGAGADGGVVLGVRMEARESGSGVLVEVDEAERMETQDALTVMREAVAAANESPYGASSPPPPLPSPSQPRQPLSTTIRRRFCSRRSLLHYSAVCFSAIRCSTSASHSLATTSHPPPHPPLSATPHTASHASCSPHSTRPAASVCWSRSWPCTSQWTKLTWAR